MLSPSFEPSKAVKEYYLYTAKTPVTLGGVTLPGLFSTRYKTPFLLLFLLALILEIYGMFTLYNVGGFHYGFAVLLVLLDLIFAFLGHLPQKKITIIKNERLLTDESIRQEQLRRKMLQYRIRQNFFYFLIGFLAIFKIISFYFFRMLIDAPFLLLIVIYLIVAFIHIRITGYTIFEIIRSMAERNEYGKYIAKGKSQLLTNIKHSFISETHLNPCTLNGVHSLKENGINKYELETNGVLYDDELTSLVNQQQTPNAKAILATEILRHQFQNILPAQPLQLNN
jgi:hypothetical protein